VQSDAGTISLPLLTLGLPGRVAGWLLDAGLPVAPLETSAVRRGIGPDGRDRSIVIFDSRNASARTDADAAEALGYETIDAARLLSGPIIEEDPELTVVPRVDPRRRFLDALRPAIEEAGGLWLRLADFPHPYRWAVCDEAAGEASPLDSHREAAFAPALSAFAELPAPGSAAGRLPASGWLKTCAGTGRPMRVHGDPKTALARNGFDRNHLPLTWMTTLAQFADWWRFRRRIGIRAIRRGRTCEIEYLLPTEALHAYPPALEIWRGRHLAVVPLSPGQVTLHDDSLPFQLNVSRHPAGFAADAMDSDFAGRPPQAVMATPV
jgi:hypothetical protein